MKAVVLIDNISDGDLCGEWGLSVYIEHGENRILLDTGKSGLFAENAEKLGIDISKVDHAVLSHAHYDHSDGADTFFEKNKSACLYVRRGAAENCYHKISLFTKKYIGIKRGTLEKYADRIKYVDGDFEICQGVFLIPHKTAGLDKLGSKARMFRDDEDGHLVPDDFSHEQSLVVKTEKGLVIFNSCSHGGAYNIIDEVSKTFPDHPIAAFIGGFHLFRSSEKDVHDFAKRMKDIGIEKAVTGHCTGDAAYEILKRELGDRIEKLYSGYTFEI